MAGGPPGRPARPVGRARLACRERMRDMTATEPGHDWDDSYAGPSPPWDIGRPQPAFVRLAEAGALTGALLDAGCGTGEHTILAASHGARALGVDVSPRAIEMARRKATERRVDVQLPGVRRAPPRDARRGIRHDRRQRAVPRLRRRPSCPVRHALCTAPSVRAGTCTSCASATASPETGVLAASPKGSCTPRSDPAGASQRSPPTASRSTPSLVLRPRKPGWPTSSARRPREPAAPWGPP